ncbi:MAG: SDR family oxidoreductase [Rhodospirillaceae bacterium]|nr:SDR family oxidoreductase [Rhodospirillaceae bacterium]
MFRSDLLAGKRILVTGGGSGLGRELTEEYLRLGAEMHICGRRGSVLDDTAGELMAAHGGSVGTQVCDIRDAEAVDEMVGQIWTEAGPLTGLVNNAAGNIQSPTNKLSTRGFDAVAGIVFHGSYYVTHACGRRWIEQGLTGSVLSILVTWVWTGSPYVVPSAMSKAGINVMTKSLAVEWAKYGIRLNAVAPGPFPTPGAWERLRPEKLADGGMNDDTQRIPMGRFGDMAELKNIGAFLMADGCDYLTGQCIAIDGGGHLADAGNYAHLLDRSDEEWQRIRALAKSASDKDKALRGS